MKKQLLLILFLALPIMVQAQKELYQGLFLYQFSKYIRWPDTHNSSDFIITVIGSEKSLKSVQNMAEAKRQTQGLNIVVLDAQNIDEIENPHIIFIDASKSNTFNSVYNKVKNKPVLLVTEGAGLGEKGSIINFVEKDGKMRFELNKGRAESIGLKISSSLLSLAIII